MDFLKLEMMEVIYKLIQKIYNQEPKNFDLFIVHLDLINS